MQVFLDEAIDAILVENAKPVLIFV